MSAQATHRTGDIRYEIVLDRADDVAGWRDKARRLLMEGVRPERLVWTVRAQAQDRLDLGEGDAPPIIHPDGDRPDIRIAKDLLRLVETALLHSAEERFALAYRLVWRAQTEPRLHRNPADADVKRLNDLAKAVRRDIHKMHAFVRFRKVGDEGDRERFVAWFEPAHHIERAVAPFFRNRFNGMDWLIVTPRASIAWDGRAIATGSGGQRADVPQSDAVDEEWRTYYASIFNPARLKVQAMKSEMPVKYWKNLPEAELIAPLVRAAGARTAAMLRANKQTSVIPAEAGIQLPTQRHIRGQEMDSRFRGNDGLEKGLGALVNAMPPKFASRDELYAALAQAPDLPRDNFAERIVPGHGPDDANIMIVGEQPGDEEDRQGMPFVGPAGRKLDEALAAAGIDRNRLVLTNAVKRFKYQQRGKRRVHQSPSAGDIDRHRWWLEQEIALVRPKLLIALGGSAGRALLGKAVTIARMRGALLDWYDGRKLLVTIHPSYLLRLPDPAGQRIEEEKFVRDLQLAAPFAQTA